MSRNFRNWRWAICGVLFLAVVVSFVDRLTFETATPLIAREFGLTNGDIGTIAAAFIVGLYPGMILWGRITDLVGSRIGMSIAVTGWSIVEILTTGARTAGGFGSYRFLLGLGESAVGPGATRAIAEWFGIKERALAISIFVAGANVAGIIGYPTTAFMMVHLGWRSAFMLPGVLGFGWVLAWLVIYRPLSTHPYVSVEERQAIRSNMPPDESAEGRVEGEDKRMAWRELFRHRQIWGVTVMRFFSEPFGYVFGAFMPKYLVMERGIAVVEMGLLMGIPPISGTLGLISGGLISRHLTLKGWSVDRVRKSLMVLGLLLVPLSVPLVLTRSGIILCIFLVVHSFGLGLWSANVNTLPIDLIPRHLVASAHGVLALGGGLGGLITVKLVGVIADRISSLAPVLVGVFLIPVLGILVTLFGIGKIEMIQSSEASNDSRGLSVSE